MSHPHDTPSLDTPRIDTSAALDAFWGVIAAQYPTAKTGDLSPGTSEALDEAAEKAMTEWVRKNVPTEPHVIAGNVHYFTAVDAAQLEQIDTTQAAPSHVGLVIPLRALRAAEAAAQVLQAAGQPDCRVSVAGAAEVAFDGEIDDQNFFDNFLVVTAGAPGEIGQRFIECEYELPEGGLTTFSINITGLQPVSAAEFADSLEALRDGTLVPNDGPA